jgi:hypothetical protein
VQTQTQLPALTFEVESAQAVEFAAAPTLTFALRISSDLPVRSLALNTQIRIAPARRRYSDQDQERLVDLFGPPERWGETLRTFRWTQASNLVPPFEGSTLVEVAVPCTYDFEVATAKYFYGLEDGDVPLEFLFSGTIFYIADGARLQAAQIPWESEATFRLPIQVWKQALDAHFPRTAWLRVREETFARLANYKSRHALPTWDATFDRLLGE